MTFSSPQGQRAGSVLASGMGTIALGSATQTVSEPLTTTIDKVSVEAAGQSGSTLLPVAILSVTEGVGFTVGTLTGAVTAVAQDFTWRVF